MSVKPRSRILRYFEAGHLPEDLRKVSVPFGELAHEMDRELDGPELETGLRKLLEAKDCFVRAALDKRAALNAARIDGMV